MRLPADPPTLPYPQPGALTRNRVPRFPDLDHPLPAPPHLDHPPAPPRRDRQPARQDRRLCRPRRTRILVRPRVGESVGRGVCRGEEAGETARKVLQGRVREGVCVLYFLSLSALLEVVGRR